MCYDVRYLTKKQIDYARRFGADEEDIAELEQQLRELEKRTGPVFHATGFDHPDIPVITNEAPGDIQLFYWGLIPWWVKTAEDSVKISNQNLNARAETLFSKPSFKEAAERRRCMVIVDGFFEHHHFKGKTYPYHIKLKSDEPFALAGIWEKWRLKSEGITLNTVAIVTTSANPLMAEIHNNPAMLKRGGPRMPLILPKELERQWLRPVDDPVDIEALKDLARAYPEEEMVAYTVPRLRGKAAVGNAPEAIQKMAYEELESTQGSLF